MDSINQVVEKNESTVAVFTTLDKFRSNLNVNDDGTGYTGDWIIREKPNVEYIVIYHRK